MAKQVDFDKYTEFVNAVTSEESKYGGHFQDRLRDLYSKEFNTHRALTAALGPVSYTHLTLPTILLV